MGSRLETNSSQTRKRIESHTFTDETGEEYDASKFGGFGDYFRRKKIKLQNLDAVIRASSGGEKPQIFKGVVAHVNGYTQPPLHILHRTLVQHGASFLQYLDSKTSATHIIASSLTPKKAVEFSRYRIVQPAWVVDSVNAGRLLPWTNYRVLDEGPRQKIFKPTGGVLSQASPLKRGYRGQTDGSHYTSHLLSVDSSGTRPSIKSSEDPPPHLAHEDTKAKSRTSSAKPAKAVTFKRTVSQKAAPGDDGLSLSHRFGSFADADAREDAVDDSDLGDTLGTENPQLEIKLSPTGNEISTIDERLPLPLDLDDPSIDTEPAVDMIDNYLGANRELLVQPCAMADTVAKEVPSHVGAGQDTPQAQTAWAESMTSEEYNAWLLSDPQMRKASSANPKFLQQFYSESRLHHLSTWKAQLKSRMQRLAAKRGPALRPAKKEMAQRRYILHVDFDCFFCAVSLKEYPKYLTVPTVVAHSAGNGSEIASCNYPAREIGIKNGMWMKRALELCPELKVLPYNFPAYEEVSCSFYESILKLGGVVQSVSVDEALVDITEMVCDVNHGDIEKERAQADEVALNLRNEIKLKTDCAVSVGIGGNILLAKVALRRAKPAGQFHIRSEDALDILGSVRVDELPGVARSISGRLDEIGVRLVSELGAQSRERLVSLLGPKTATKLLDYCRGVDRAEVGDQPVRKTVSAEISWGIRFVNQQEAEEFVVNLCLELERRLLVEHVKGRQLTVKIMRRAPDAPLDPVKHLGHGKCDSFSRSVGFGVATCSAETIGREAVAVLRSFKFCPGDLRGLGVQLSKLEPIEVCTAPGAAQISQKQLTFHRLSGPPPSRRVTMDVIEEISPHKSGAEASEIRHDRVEEFRDVVKPRRTKSRSALGGRSAKPGDTPLNISGTQFILPANADPAVLEELPRDIRERLTVSHQQGTLAPHAKPWDAQAFPPSQVDAEVFRSLPDEVKAEVLASYDRGGGPKPWPQKTCGGAERKTSTTPTKRGSRGRGRGGRRGRVQADQGRLQDTGYWGRRTDGSEQDSVEELDPEVLAALPEDLRREVLEEYRSKSKGREEQLESREDWPQDELVQDEEMPEPSRTRFPSPPKIIPFSGLQTDKEIWAVIEAWQVETADDGPHRDDVEVLELYLARVVGEERDMDKAVRLVRRLTLAVEADSGSKSNRQGREAWEKAMLSIKAAVRGAARRRGIGPLRF